MSKKFLIALFLFSFINLPVFAEKIPVKITPAQIISTHHDEVEVGDRISFKIKKDVIANDKIYISKDTPIYGAVDFLHNNGWGGDSADITFKTFYTKDVNGNKIAILYPLEINGNSELTNKTRDITIVEIAAFTGVYFGHIFRGAEIYIEPDTSVYNLFIEK